MPGSQVLCKRETIQRFQGLAVKFFTTMASVLHVFVCKKMYYPLHLYKELIHPLPLPKPGQTIRESLWSFLEHVQAGNRKKVPLTMAVTGHSLKMSYVCLSSAPSPFLPTNLVFDRGADISCLTGHKKGGYPPVNMRHIQLLPPLREAGLFVTMWTNKTSVPSD